ncbi:TlpA family protein disulfide reductase [Zunongwangia sp.]|uniref:TlpA family protein disulfide reductase n=1 Tax=Zunongwangia sp. TaxID=1965325 RepID=UPI003AA860E5
MKISTYNLSLFLILITSNFCIGQSHIRIIDKPDYEVTNSGITHIHRIETTPEETRITILSKFIPGWWVNFTPDTYLRDVDTNKKYKIKEVVGAEFDEKLWTPESGEQFTELIFEPLSSSTQKIDYIDSSNKILSVSLNKSRSKTNEEVPPKVLTWIKEEISKSDLPLKSFDSPDFFKRKMGRVVGYIKGYDPRLGFETGIIYIGNELTREEYPIVAEINPDGRFEAEIPLINPIEIYMILYKQGFSFYIEPGSTIGLVLDWEEFLLADRYRNRRYKFKDIKYYGPLAKINNELTAFSPDRIDYRKEFKEWVETLAPLDYQTKILDLYAQNKTKLNNYIADKNISKKAEDFLKDNIKLIASTDMFDYIDRRNYLKKEDSTNTVLKIDIPDSYYEAMQFLLPVNKPAALASSQYSSLINRLEYAKPLMEVQRKSQMANVRQPEKTILEYFEDEGIFLEEKYKNFFKATSKDESTKLDSLEIVNLSRAFNEKYKTELQNYYKKYVEVLPEDRARIELEKWNKKDSVMVHYFGINKGLASDIIKVRSLKFWFDAWGKESSDLVWQDLKQDIANPFVKAEGQRMYEKAYPEEQLNETETVIDGNVIASNISNKNKLILPQGKGTTAFRNITDPFKGKILFIDFWATTCGPCVANIKRMKKIREKYKNNPDFEFVFITDESQSPKKSYDKFIAEQELEHVYRVDQSTFHRFRDLFSFNGIPRYIVMDKAGDVVDSYFKMHDFNYELPKILTKYK